MRRRSTQYEQAQGGLGAVSPELRQLTEPRSHEPKIRKPDSVGNGGWVSERRIRIEMGGGARLPALPQGQMSLGGR